MFNLLKNMQLFLEMNIEPFLISSTVNLVIAQRLVRRICTNCVVSETVTKKQLKEKFSAELINAQFADAKESVRLYRGKGCPVCSGTGYQGRIGIYEVMVVSEKVREVIMQRANADQLRELARKEGMHTMMEDGIKKVLAGQTTIEEVLRATREKYEIFVPRDRRATKNQKRTHRRAELARGNQAAGEPGLVYKKNFTARDG